MPEEWNRRQQDKLAYRYPRGESYLDVIHRLDPIVHEVRGVDQNRKPDEQVPIPCNRYTLRPIVPPLCDYGARLTARGSRLPSPRTVDGADPRTDFDRRTSGDPPNNLCLLYGPLEGRGPLPKHTTQYSGGARAADLRLHRDPHDTPTEAQRADRPCSGRGHGR
jgi:hypothetical protein